MLKKHLLHRKLTAKAGRKNKLSIILTDAAKIVSNAKGCKEINRQC